MEKLRRLQALYDFHAEYLKNPRIKKRELHKKCSPYRAENSTSDLISEAFDNAIYTGPFIYCNSGISVSLLKDVKKPLQYIEEKKKDENTTYAVSLMGDYSFLIFEKGASMLSYSEVVRPSFQGKSPEDIFFDSGEKLPEDPHPHGWSDVDWDVYDLMRVPTRSFVDVGRLLGITWQAVKNHYDTILKDCKVSMTLLPEGYYRYSSSLMTFKTQFETGLRKELEELDRSSYLWKCGDTIILNLFVSNRNYNTPHRKFKEMEEIGIISDLTASIPIENYNFLTEF